MIIAAHQTNFVPYLGFFYKIYKCDRYIFVDDVEFSNKNGFNHHKNMIKTANGGQFIRVPVKKSNTSLLNETLIDYSVNWQEKLIKTLMLSYKKADHYEEVISWFKEAIEKKYDNFAEMNIEIIKYLCEHMDMKRDFCISSEKKIEGTKGEWVINLVKEFGGDTYYSGTGAMAYLTEEKFIENGMSLVFSDYRPIIYKQLWKEFIPDMSVLDFVFNEGFKNPFDSGYIFYD